jgi:predicted O-methyltransferase YrrM
MVKYNLDHLVQSDKQMVMGPIQDDEALLLYSIVKTMRMKRILEIGGLDGYSARNFLAAMDENGTLHTVDVNPVATLSKNHKVIQKDVRNVTADDLPKKPLDMVFFDCHHPAQMDLYERLSASGNIDRHTLIALHDTAVHYDQKGQPRAQQFVEREMTVKFGKMGYELICLHPRKENLDEKMPFRHGLTLCSMFLGLDPDPIRKKIKLI